MKNLNVVGLFCLLLVSQLSYASHRQNRLNRLEQRDRYRASLMRNQRSLSRASIGGAAMLLSGIVTSYYAVDHLRDYPEQEIYDGVFICSSILSLLGAGIVVASHIAQEWNQQEINRMSRSHRVSRRARNEHRSHAQGYELVATQDSDSALSQV